MHRCSLENLSFIHGFWTGACFGNQANGSPAGARRKANDPVEHGAPDEGLHKAVGQAQDGHRQRKCPLQQRKPVFLFTLPNSHIRRRSTLLSLCRHLQASCQATLGYLKQYLGWQDMLYDLYTANDLGLSDCAIRTPSTDSSSS